MNNEQINPHNGRKRHKCEVTMQGNDWYMLTCPHCSYISLWNQRTKQSNTLSAGDKDAYHRAKIDPPGAQVDKIHSN